MKTFVKSIVIIAIFVFVQSKSYAHCEIPCGIYHDELRIELLKEHIQTIEKSMKMIEELESAKNINYNQLVRWIDNKEEHANEIQEIVYQYFMNQRVKVVDPSESEKYKKYVKQITLLHEMLIFSMKAKQSTDHQYIDKLNETLEDFEESYFEGKDHRHDVGAEHKH